MQLAGALGYHVLQIAVWRRDRPRDVATLLGIGRPLEIAIPLGGLIALVFGIWLAYVDEEIPKYRITDEWIIAALLLWVVGMAVGERGGRIYGDARKLAQRLAGESDSPSAELRALIQSRRAAILTTVGTLVFVAVLVLMVWKPGAP
jgi:hypothetical protein